MTRAKLHNELFGNIARFARLREAALKAVRGKRSKPGAAGFMANLEKHLIGLEARLQSGAWRSGGYTEIEISEPKHRLVSAAPFRDRVVHHALCSVVAPIFERGFIADSYANRSGKGTHRAVTRYEKFRDRYRYVLRCDIYRYFPAIDHAILKGDLRRKVGCEPTLALLDHIIDGSNPQEEVNAFFPGDDLLDVAGRRRGLPIGNLTSQLFGNVYLNGFDHFVKEILRAPYLRYALFRDGWFDPLREPESPLGGRVLRGGSWNNNPNNTRSANRNNNTPANRNNNIGFRVGSTLRIARADTFTEVSGEFRSVQGLS